MEIVDDDSAPNMVKAEVIHDYINDLTAQVSLGEDKNFEIGEPDKNTFTGIEGIASRLASQNENGDELVTSDADIQPHADDVTSSGDFNFRSVSAQQLNKLLIDSMSNGTARQAELLSKLIPPTNAFHQPSFQQPYTTMSSQPHLGAENEDVGDDGRRHGRASGELIMSALRLAMAARQGQQHVTAVSSPTDHSLFGQYCNGLPATTTSADMSSATYDNLSGDVNNVFQVANSFSSNAFAVKRENSSDTDYGGESNCYQHASGGAVGVEMMGRGNRMARRSAGVPKEKKYVCDQCGKRFGYKHILQEHKNLHYGIKPYACPLCNKRFAAKSNLIQHRHRHIANEQLQQRQMQQIIKCENGVGQGSPKHESVNSADSADSPAGGLTAFEQGAAAPATTETDNADSAIKPEHASVFQSDTYLSETRSGTATFSCSQCNSNFVSDKSLRAHEASAHQRSLRNSSVMSFRCVICGQTFLDGDDYANHCRNVHPDTDVNPTRRPYIPRNIRNQSIDSQDNASGLKCPLNFLSSDGLLRIKNESCESLPYISQLGMSWNGSSQSPQDQRKRSNTQIDGMSLSDDVNDGAILGRPASDFRRRCFRSCEVSAEPNTLTDTRAYMIHESARLGHSKEDYGSLDRPVDASIQVDPLCSQLPGDEPIPPMDDLLARYVAQGRLFKCRFCEIYFKERGLYSMHLVLHGDDNPWQCSVCGRQMLDRNEFTLHFVNQQQHQNA